MRSWHGGLLVAGFVFVSWSAPAFASSVVINEFVARPEGEEGEWVELRNPGPDPVNVSGWALADATDRPRALGDAPLLAPGALLLVAARPESLRARYGIPDSVPVLRPSGWPILNDHDAEGGAPADRLRLLDAGGGGMDSVAYFEAWLPAEDGRSLERVAYDLPGNDAGAWAWSEDPRGATPGRANSLAPPEGDPEAVLTGPERVAPSRGASVYAYRTPGPGTLELRLLDRDGGEAALLRPPGPASASGTWVWGASAPLPPRSGLYLLCLLWRGPEAGILRRCVSVWVDR